MARVTYGSIITSFRGSIGGTVFQNNKYGFTAKNTPAVKKPNSPYVYNTQRILAMCVQHWGQLSQAQRDNFNTFASSYPQYAANNPTAQLSGYNIAVRWWFHLLLSGYSFNDVPVFASAEFMRLSPVVNNDAGDLYINLGADGDLSSNRRSVFLSGLYPAQKTFKPSNFRYIVTTDTPNLNYEITQEYGNNFGATPQPGEFLFLKVVSYNYLSPFVLSDDFSKIEVE